MVRDAGEVELVHIRQFDDHIEHRRHQYGVLDTLFRQLQDQYVRGNRMMQDESAGRCQPGHVVDPDRCHVHQRRDTKNAVTGLQAAGGEHQTDQVLPVVVTHGAALGLCLGSRGPAQGKNIVSTYVSIGNGARLTAGNGGQLVTIQLKFSKTVFDRVLVPIP